MVIISANSGLQNGNHTTPNGTDPGTPRVNGESSLEQNHEPPQKKVYSFTNIKISNVLNSIVSPNLTVSSKEMKVSY